MSTGVSCIMMLFSRFVAFWMGTGFPVPGTMADMAEFEADREARRFCLGSHGTIAKDKYPRNSRSVTRLFSSSNSSFSSSQLTLTLSYSDHILSCICPGAPLSLDIKTACNDTEAPDTRSHLQQPRQLFATFYPLI